MNRKPSLLRTLPALVAVAASGWTFVACGGGGSGGGGGGGISSVFLGSASRADLSGQQSAYTGALGAGTTITFPAVRFANYFFQVETQAGNEDVVLDVYSEDGTWLDSKTVTTPGAWGYSHKADTQHVLVFVRPWNPVDTSMTITRLTVTGIGPYAQDKLHVNFIVAGKFTGLGVHNDLVSTADQAAFTDAVMAKVKTHFQQLGITITYGGFAYTAAQVGASHPTLVGPDEQTLCGAGETLSSTGFQKVATADLDRWGSLGFPASAPSFDAAHGIDVFFIHHFTTDGTVGLSPRPGQMLGNGADTALAAAGFLKVGGTLSPRTIDQIALVIAHELGHFLGLLHTSTFDPSPANPTRAIDDGIADTPACTVLTDNNGDGVVGFGDGCQDEGNIMFYQSAAQTVFTPQQGNVVKALLSVQEH